MTKLDDDEIVVASWNFERNGQDHNGDSHRREHGMRVLSELGIDVLLRQELTGAHLKGKRAALAEARVLGGEHGPAFTSFLAPPNPDSGNATGIYTNPLLFAPVAEPEHANGMTIPLCSALVRLVGAEKEISFNSTHLCYYCGDQRAKESRRVTTLRSPGKATLVAGGFNSGDKGVHFVKWDRVHDRTHVEHRTIHRDGQWVTDTRPDEILTRQHNGQPLFIDLARYAATVLGQREALAPTASLWRRDQGPMLRIDRMYATPEFAAALKRVRVVINEDVLAASDHVLVLAVFSRRILRRELTLAA
ncbi:endonuclease/exonuclease/phosphatase family protein [Streptomyces sp. NPDC050161]|uniref:endonuclease/exonuclease/phosphatase family protein n=1 Tax=Streptomyces sp. NPDC050161 TaxID=3365604 RepID=UPI00379CF9B2